MENVERISLLGTYVDNLNMEETIFIIQQSLKQKKHIQHTVVNAGKIAVMNSNPVLRESVNSATLINADGMAVVWASKWLNKPLKERVAGIDLFLNLVKSAYENKQQIYLLGAKQSIVEKVAAVFQEQYGKNIIAGFRNGYFEKEEETEIVNDIVASKANYLFVAMSSPKKEIFLFEHREKLQSVGFVMGVGGSFDVVSGAVKRAPLWIQKIGMEWFYRFLQEPRRMWKRSFVTNAKFIKLVMNEKLKRGA